MGKWNRAKKKIYKYLKDFEKIEQRETHYNRELIQLRGKGK
jgi:hypothetical protein